MSSKLTLPQGVYHDRLISAQGQIIDLGWHSNIIVDRCRYLLAAFIKGDKPKGVHLLAVGKGKEEWDSAPLEPPATDITALMDPRPCKIKIAPNEITYLDTTGAGSTVPINRIQIQLTLDPGTPPIGSGQPSYPLREFGLFGRLGREDYMIDYVRHPVIHKQAGDTLVRTIRLIF